VDVVGPVARAGGAAAGDGASSTPSASGWLVVVSGRVWDTTIPTALTVPSEPTTSTEVANAIRVCSG
jgi:hypothetical protein